MLRIGVHERLGTYVAAARTRVTPIPMAKKTEGKAKLDKKRKKAKSANPPKTGPIFLRLISTRKLSLEMIFWINYRVDKKSPVSNYKI